MNRKFLISLLRRGVPALFTLVGSAGILIGAHWIHQQQIAAKLETTTTQAPSDSGGQTQGTNAATESSGGLSQSKSLGLPNTKTGTNNTDKSSVTPTAPSKSTTSQTQVPASSSISSNITTSSSSNTMASSSGATVASTRSGNVGYTPVQGGIVQTIPGPTSGQAVLPACAVQQYGSQPQTTLTTANLQIPSGGTLSVPAEMTKNSLLAIPLQQGVLWAVVPATAMTPQGGLGAAQKPTTLYYTPYPATTVSHLELTQGAIRLGVLPLATHIRNTPWTGWYTPPTNLLQKNANTTSVTRLTNSVQSNTTASDTPTATAGTDKISIENNTSPTSTPATLGSQQPSGGETLVNSKTPLPAGQAYLYLSSLYATEGGAVITIAVNEPQQTQNITWTYLWKEQDLSLQPLASLANGKGMYSWLAVGKQLVYWGQRSMIPPDNRYFKGKQSVLNVISGKITAIRLGTWTSQAQASGNDLQFRIQNSTQWEQFTPAPELVTH
ncbi:hypothetical protein D2Q93_02000 [Alicyclobacillaceae bacterium I2511]|nr:hypothetical protein D2Q93_02000 [Alicyclobacillaceae bacterium I2511]